MSVRKRNTPGRVRVRSIRRTPPDLKKLSKALIDLALAQAETDAKAEHAEAAEKPGGAT